MAKVEVRKNFILFFDKFVFLGCAFVTFQKRQCALNAIKSMHQSQTMEVGDLFGEAFSRMLCI
jgi:hypothetical protein